MRPLTRATVTYASLIMLPAYVLLTAGLGLIYIFNPLGRLDHQPSLTYPREVMGGSMVPWGVLFVLLSGMMAFCLLTYRRLLQGFALCMCAVSFFIWTILYIVSIFRDPAASFTTPLWPLFAMTACIASTVSVLREEV